MMDLVDSGINSIQSSKFKSSKIKEFERQSVKNGRCQKKAEDYVSVLAGQKWEGDFSDF